MFERPLARAPTSIQSFERVANRCSIGFIVRQHTFATLNKIEVVPDCFRIEASQRGRVAQVVEKQFALTRNVIEREFLYAQSGLFRRSVTGSFGGTQSLGVAPAGAFYAVRVASASVSGARG